MGFLASLFAAIFSFMPVLIFGLVFKIIKYIIDEDRKSKNYDKNSYDQREKSRRNKTLSFEDLKKEAIKKVNSRNSDSDKSFKLDLEDISNLVKKNKEKLEYKGFLTKENKEKALEDYKKLRNKGYSKEDAFMMVKDSNGNSKIVRQSLENELKDNRISEKLKENLIKSNDLKDKGKIIDSEFIRECESDNISYEDDSVDNDLLAFNEEDYIKFQIYKEIFDKPLSLR